MDSPFMGIGLMQEAKTRNLDHGDWDRDYRSLQELSERNERSRTIWNAVAKVVQVFRPGLPTLRAAHV
jgi:hypothetical protein